jgi:hypothetical protein
MRATEHERLAAATLRASSCCVLTFRAAFMNNEGRRFPALR